MYHLGPHRDVLVERDLDGDAQHGPVLDKDWERFHAHHVKSKGLRTAIWSKYWITYLLSTCDRSWSRAVYFTAVYAGVTLWSQVGGWVVVGLSPPKIIFTHHRSHIRPLLEELEGSAEDSCHRRQQVGQVEQG